MSIERRPAIALLTLCALLAGCDYDPPPDVSLQAAEAGVFTSGDPLVLKFSEPVAASTLTINIWPDLRDLEGELPASTQPHLTGCDEAGSPCGTTTVRVADDGLSAIVQLDAEDLGQPDVPLLLEVTPGLEDGQGNATGASAWFDFQFQPAPIMNAGPIEFDSGVFIVVSVIEEPLPAILTLSTHILALEDGRFALAGGELDPIEGAAKNTANPDELFIDTGDEGFALFSIGRLTITEDGERFMESDPFDVTLAIGPVQLTLGDVRISGKIQKNPDTDKDRINGTLSFASLTLFTGGNSFDYDPGTSTFLAEFAPEAKIPEGTPDICGELCAITLRGPWLLPLPRNAGRAWDDAHSDWSETAPVTLSGSGCGCGCSAKLSMPTNDVVVTVSSNEAGAGAGDTDMGLGARPPSAIE